MKKPYNHINWLHNAIKVPDFSLCQCLFGLHRVNEDYQKTVAIVESEKTAIMHCPQIVSNFLGAVQTERLFCFNQTSMFI
ncbi:DUF6371 domain-containing protein [Flavobacterium sp.]|uniref:DUF6371 domain-containing protein n=1 Tax=Flavobacterium sp. TaxID=239 RepID=UPI0037BBFC51